MHTQDTNIIKKRKKKKKSCHLSFKHTGYYVTEHNEQTASVPIITWQRVHKTSGERLLTVKLVLENKNL